MAPRKSSAEMSREEKLDCLLESMLARSNGRINWDALERVMKIATPVILAFIGYLTVVNGKKAGEAAESAQAAAEVIVKGDSARGAVLDTVHKIVNQQRTDLQEVNQTLREFITEKGFKQPPGTEQVR